MAADAVTADKIAAGAVENAAIASGIAFAKLSQPEDAFDMNGQRITNVGAPTSASDAASKTYVDTVAPTVLSGAGAPDTPPSAEGDLYVDTDANILYVAQNTTAWAIVGRDVYKRTAVATTAYSVLASDDLVAVTSTATQATTLTLPTVSSLSARGSMKTITVVDEGGSAATNSITIVPSAGDTILGNSNGLELNADFNSVTLYCVAPTSWFVRA
jgi:hypothetical protein